MGYVGLRIFCFNFLEVLEIMIGKDDYALTLRELESQLLQNGLQKVVLEAGIKQLQELIDEFED